MILVSTIFLFSPQPLRADPQGRELMAAVLDRNDGTTEWGKISLSTCRTRIKGGKLICAGPARVKELEMVRKDYGPREKDKKTLTLIREPAGERGISFLQYDYEALGKETDQWLFLTALGKVKRIVSGNENEPKTGSFFGSEFNYEDLEQKLVEEFTYKILGHEKFQGVNCTVIQALPTPDKARRSNYSKALHWIDPGKNMILKSLLFNRRGEKCKRIYALDIRRVEGIWVPFTQIVHNPIEQRRSVFTYQAITLNRPLPDALLSRRSLTDAAFRETRFRALSGSPTQNGTTP
ncbi:MAG: outer membrane lipoprotein-sorting protein [Desulfobacterales bacterium]|nr:outer membrane lipoprotein-sorting protein [Desulfobacterales bacterium]